MLKLAVKRLKKEGIFIAIKFLSKIIFKEK